jgi:DNA-binding transcriptional ArsR family regulator
MAALPPESRITSDAYMSPESDASVLADKLDLLISIQKIAHRSALDAERAEISADPVSESLLGHATNWTDAGALQKAVAGATKASIPTIKRRIAQLVDRGLVKREGAGRSVRYRSTGLIDP